MVLVRQRLDRGQELTDERDVRNLVHRRVDALLHVTAVLGRRVHGGVERLRDGRRVVGVLRERGGCHRVVRFVGDVGGVERGHLVWA